MSAYFCPRCGELCSIMGHETGTCTANPAFVALVESQLALRGRVVLAPGAAADEALRNSVAAARRIEEQGRMDETEAVQMTPMMSSSRDGSDDRIAVASVDDAQDYDDEAETEPARLTLCRAAHVYGIPTKSGWGRLVIAQEPNPEALKLTISEPDGKGGYRSANLRIDADGYRALKALFSGYGSDNMPMPETRTKPTQAARVSRQLKTLQIENAKLREELEADRPGRPADIDKTAQGTAQGSIGEVWLRQPLPPGPQAPTERVTLRGTRNYVNDDPAGGPTRVLVVTPEKEK